MKTRLLCSVTTTLLALPLLCLASGCAWSIGGGKTTTGSGAPAQSPTRGQELIDLKRAHDACAISDEEYEIMRRRIMDE